MAPDFCFTLNKKKKKHWNLHDYSASYKEEEMEYFPENEEAPSNWVTSKDIVKEMIKWKKEIARD